MFAAASPLALQRLVALRHVCVVVFALGLAITAAALPRTVEYQPEPLYANMAHDAPSLVLAFSTEFTIAGAAHSDTEYDPRQDYLGYFDNNSCYRYNNKNTEWYTNDRQEYITGNQRNTGFYYRISASNAQKKCVETDAFSGNLLNFATTSAIDIVRLALTGGDRLVDENKKTILQRAYLPDDFYTRMYFPLKTVSPDHARGSIPRDLSGGGIYKKVYITNCRYSVFMDTTEPLIKPSLTDKAAECDRRHKRLSFVRPPGQSGHLDVRVRVCDSLNSANPSAWDKQYCQSYPNGNHKPVGVLQKNADKIRVATFGYLLPANVQESEGLHGGVLYSAMKYLGPNNFASNGVKTPNPSTEWDEQTGILRKNPEWEAVKNIWNATKYSGTINYINKLGSIYQRYKDKDPLGELYYEALAYLQGKPPHPKSTNSADYGRNTTEFFPFYYGNNRPDPHAHGSSSADYSCTPQNILVVGDTHNWYSRSLPGNTYGGDPRDFSRVNEVNEDQGVPNFVDWTKIVRAFEQNDSMNYVDGQGRAQNTQGPARVTMNAMADYPNMEFNTRSEFQHFYTAAGAAYWANTHDIRPATMGDKARLGMRAKTYVLDVDQLGRNSNNWEVRRKTALYLMAKYGGFNDRFETGNPFVDGQGGLDEGLWARNPESDQKDPRTYFYTSSAEATLKNINDIFLQLKTDVNSIAPAAQSTTTLADGQKALIYRAEFSIQQKTGDVVALPITRTGSQLTMQPPIWSAARKLANTVPESRRIVIGRADKATPLKWLNLSNEQKAIFKAGDSDEIGQKRVEYITGVRTQETSATYPMRPRTELLGDIVNSGITYLGAPTKGAIRDADYYESPLFKNQQNRTPAIFVGANDGMLHAFNAMADDNGGNELFAYIPSWVTHKLPALTKPEYGTPAQPAQIYVDAAPAVAEAWVGKDRIGHGPRQADGTRTQGEWKTVLVGGTGGGGQGVYALDVSNPTAFDASKVMWEFTDKDDVDVGNISAKPKIVKIRTGTTRAGRQPTYNWFAVFASGMNNYAVDGNASASGEQAVFFLKLDHGYGKKWKLGTDYFKFKLPADVSITDANGLLDLSVITNPYTGELQKIYAGDLLGNMWRLDYSANPVKKGPKKDIGPLFIARNANGQRQPITTAPAIARLDQNALLVAFGTGKYIEKQDATDSVGQTFYTLIDSLTGLPKDGAAAIASRAKLKAASKTADDQIEITNFGWTLNKDGTGSGTGRYMGWYFDYANGERFTTHAAFMGTQLRFNTMFPVSFTQKREVCGVGKSNRYMVDLQKGSGRISSSPNALLGTPVIFTLPPVGGNGAPVPNSLGQRTENIEYAEIDLSSEHNHAAEQTISSTHSERVLSDSFLNWRTIANFKQLYEKANATAGSESNEDDDDDQGEDDGSGDGSAS